MDDAYVEDLKEELICAKELAVDENDRALIWRKDTEATFRPGSEVAPAAVSSSGTRRLGERGWQGYGIARPESAMLSPMLWGKIGQDTNRGGRECQSVRSRTWRTGDSGRRTSTRRRSSS